MPYLIDGHNLIPKIPGLSLAAEGDEAKLIELLQDFCRRQNKQAEVFFDKASPGRAGARRFGQVTAHFIHASATADQAIREHLYNLGKEARKWTVVSSDRQVQSTARTARAQILSSEAFADRLREARAKGGPKVGDRSRPTLSAQEVDEWLELFKNRKKDDR